MKFFPKIAGALALYMVIGSSALAQSLYGCYDLENHPSMPAIEGTDGVFYRILPNMQNYHSLSVGTAKNLAVFSEALATKNVTLIMALMPTKSLAMPGYLTSHAQDFGFDLELAATNYDLLLTRLDDVNVMNVNLRSAFQDVGQAELVMYRTDYRLTPLGARMMARAIAEKISALTDGPDIGFSLTVTQVGTQELESAMYNNLQQGCRVALPKNMGGVFDMTEFSARVLEGGSNLMDNTNETRGIALIGTEYTAEPTSNISGFLTRETGIEVQQYAVSGGGAFAAMSSYITSDAFRRAPPEFLVWEVPMYYNLAQFSDAPIHELTAAVTEECRVAFQLTTTENPLVVTADLGGLITFDNTALQLDIPNSQTSSVRFHLKNSAGLVVTRSIYRHVDQRKTGRFLLPLNGLPQDDQWSVEIETDAPLGERVHLTGCYY